MYEPEGWNSTYCWHEWGYWLAQPQPSTNPHLHALANSQRFQHSNPSTLALPHRTIYNPCHWRAQRELSRTSPPEPSPPPPSPPSLTLASKNPTSTHCYSQPRPPRSDTRSRRKIAWTDGGDLEEEWGGCGGECERSSLWFEFCVWLVRKCERKVLRVVGVSFGGL